MYDYPVRAFSSLTVLVLLLVIAGCDNGFDNALQPEEPAPSECLPLGVEVDRMINVLPVREGQEWEFSLYVDYGSYYESLDSVVVLRQEWRSGSMSLRFLEIQPCRDSTQAISIEKHSAYWDFSKWVDDDIVVKHDSTFVETTETVEWLATRDEIRMHSHPYSLPIPRFVRPRRDTLIFDEPCYRCEEQLVLTPETGIQEYYHYWFTHLDDPGTSIRWTRR